MKGILLSDRLDLLERVWSPSRRARLGELCFMDEIPRTSRMIAECRDQLREIEVIFSTWGMPRLSAERLSLLPALRVVFYAAGTVKPFAEPLFDRGITVVSAAAANAVPVAEYTLSQVLFGLKRGWFHSRSSRKNWAQHPVPGAYGSTIGVISLGLIGRSIAERLRAFDVKVLAYDPFIGEEEFAALGATRAASLEEIFRQSDVVTLHAPWLPATEGMVGRAQLGAMKEGATFINTSRGALVREDELAMVFHERPDLTAVLDVTHPEPPAKDSPLRKLENVILTPHIAGSMGSEVHRMADLMIEEFQRWLRGEPLRHEVTRAQFERGG